MYQHHILGINIFFCPYQEAIKEIIDSSRTNVKLRVAPIASHSLAEAQIDSRLKNVLNDLDLVLPDGQSLIWAAGFLYRAPVQERIYGPKLLLKLCSRCEKEKIRVILYGNHTNLLGQKLRAIYPKLTITALPDLNYRKIDKADVIFLLKTLNKYKKSIMFLGIGSPAQQYLLAKLQKVKTPIVAIGAAFDFVSGAKKQAPAWMQKNGLEWFFRLITEPLRLWKRYLILAPLFILLVMWQKIGLLMKND